MSPIAIVPVVHAALEAWKHVAEARNAASTPAAAGFGVEFQKAFGSHADKPIEQKLLELPEVRSVLGTMPAGKEAQLILNPEGTLLLRVAGRGEQPIQLGPESQALVQKWSLATHRA